MEQQSFAHTPCDMNPPLTSFTRSSHHVLIHHHQHHTSFSSFPLLLFFFLLLTTTVTFTFGQPEASPWPKDLISFDDYAKSVNIFNQAIKHQSTNRTHAKLLYLESVRINPHLAEAYLNLGMVCDDNKEIEEAYLAAAKAASEGRNDNVYGDAMGNLGHHIVEDSGKGHDYHVVEQAIRYYEEGLRVVPKHMSNLYNLGIAYERQGKRQEAYNAYKRVLDLDSLHIGANLNAGNLCMYAGLHNLSLALHRRALQGYEKNGHDSWWRIGLLNNMGQTNLMMFEPAEAMRLYRKALAIDNDDRMTLFNMFKVKRQMCDWDGWETISVPQMITFTKIDLKKGPNTTMMPYDVTLLPVSKELIYQVAVANLHDKGGLTPPGRNLKMAADDVLLGLNNVLGGGGERGERRRTKQLNVVYYGYDFNNHPMGHLTCGVLERHDRTKVNVKVRCLFVFFFCALAFGGKHI